MGAFDVSGFFKVWSERLGKLHDLVQSAKNVELLSAISDLLVDMSKLKVHYAELMDENGRLKAELAAARSATLLRDRLKSRGGALYLKDPDPSEPKGPYCPNCFSSGGRLVLMADHRGSALALVSRFHCATCNYQATK